LNTLKINPKSLFIDHKTLLFLCKLHQYELSLEERKLEFNSKLKINLEKETVRPDISRPYQYIS